MDYKLTTTRTSWLYPKDEFLEQIKRIAREEITTRIARLIVQPYNDAGARAVC